MSLEQKKIVNSSQMGTRIVSFQITGTTTVRTIADGSADATIAAYASDGVYVITLKKAASRTPTIVGIECATSNAAASYGVNADNKTITITIVNGASAAGVNTNFHMTLIFWDIGYSN